MNDLAESHVGCKSTDWSMIHFGINTSTPVVLSIANFTL